MMLSRWWIGARTTHRGGDKVGENVKCHFCDLLGMAVFKTYSETYRVIHETSIDLKQNANEEKGYEGNG
jgi:hypothetical protein